MGRREERGELTRRPIRLRETAVSLLAHLFPCRVIGAAWAHKDGEGFGVTLDYRDTIFTWCALCQARNASIICAKKRGGRKPNS